MQLLVKKVFNQNEIKETHKSKHNAYKKDLYVFIATTDRPKILKNTVPHNISKRPLFIVG